MTSASFLEMHQAMGVGVRGLQNYDFLIIPGNASCNGGGKFYDLLIITGNASCNGGGGRRLIISYL